MTESVSDGSPEPLGVTPHGGGVNVAVHSGSAEAIEFCLFDAAGMDEIRRVTLPGRTGDVFHGFVGNVPVGSRYGLRAKGPFDPAAGHRFNPAKLLIDPYARRLGVESPLPPTAVLPFSVHWFTVSVPKLSIPAP